MAREVRHLKVPQDCMVIHTPSGPVWEGGHTGRIERVMGEGRNVGQWVYRVRYRNGAGFGFISDIPRSYLKPIPGKQWEWEEAGE